jgi:hypothetical protein
MIAIIGASGIFPLTKSRGGGSAICFSSPGYPGSVNQTVEEVSATFPILERLRHMGLDDVAGAIEVRNRPRHAQDAMQGTATEMEPFRRDFEEPLARRVQAHVLAQLRPGQCSVQRSAGATRLLPAASLDHALPDDFASLRRHLTRKQFSSRLSWNRHLEIDTIADWS